MKKLVMFIVTVVVALVCYMPVFAQENFNDDEYNSAVSITENVWTEFKFDSSILLKTNVSDKGVTTVFEISSDDYCGELQYYVFAKGIFLKLTQNKTSSVHGYINVPLINVNPGYIKNLDASYIKIDYDNSKNINLRNKTLKIRKITLQKSLFGWEDATELEINEEYTVKITSPNDSKWYKITIPDDQFKYICTMCTPDEGCFISELYTEEDLKAGSVQAEEFDCINAEAFECTKTIQSGMGTYYLHLYPVPFYDGELTSKIVFETENKKRGEVSNTDFGAQVSVWATEEIEKAFDNNLIPDVLLDSDMTQSVNRGEFAAIAIRLYEALTQERVEEPKNCPLVDIQYNDNEKAIKKAYQLEIAQGTSATTYEPLDNINREQLATMLCRVIKKCNYPNWTLATDSQYNLDVYGVALFADDNEISDWAKKSVYYMAKNGIIKGVSETHFAPRNVTLQQERMGYASATIEQAIIVSQRIFEQGDTIIVTTR